ncbi:MAG: gluconokinase [Desulfovibrionaceae bacterium]
MADTAHPAKPTPTPDPLILAIDVGSSSVRCALFDGLGGEVEGVAAREPFHLVMGADGAAEAHPALLFDLVCHCVDTVLAKAGPLAGAIAGVGVCTFVANVMGLDVNGRPLTRLATYADTRAAPEADALRRDHDEDAAHQRTGCRFHPGYLPAQLLRLERREPALFRAVARWVSFWEFVELTVFGATSVSPSVASWSGLLDRRALAWDGPLLDVVGLGPGMFSPLSGPGEARRGLRAPFAARWPALRDVPWFPAVGDGAAANVGSGCVSPDRIALSLGTTSAMRIVTQGDAPYVAPGLWGYRVDHARHLSGGALSEGGNVFAWMRGVLGLEGADALAGLARALDRMEPDGHGLTVLPFFSGERAPGWAGHARATFHGMSLATTREELVLAGLEAVAYRLGMVFDLLAPLASPAAQVVACGGAVAASPPWMRIIADVLGREVAVAAIPEASARGAALLALENLGAVPDLAAVPVAYREAYRPDPARHAVYRAAMARQAALYGLLVPQHDAPLPSGGASGAIS